MTLSISTENDNEVNFFEIAISDFDGNQFFFNKDFEANEDYVFDICLPPGCYLLEMIQNVGNNFFNTPYSLVDAVWQL